MFDERNLRSADGRQELSESLRRLQDYGYAPGILKKLATEADVRNNPFVLIFFNRLASLVTTEISREENNCKYII